MRERRKLRSLHTGWLLLCVLCVCVVALPAAASADPTSGECDARVNDTPGKLVECVQTGDLLAHMQASAGHRQRESGPGRASVAQLRRAGLQGVGGLRRQGDAGRRLRRQLQKYQFDYYAYTGIPTMSANGRDFVLGGLGSGAEPRLHDRRDAHRGEQQRACRRRRRRARRAAATRGTSRRRSRAIPS